MKVQQTALAVVLMLLLPGCLYVHTMQPVTLDMHRTPVSNHEKTGSVKLIQFPPIWNSQKLVAWGSAAIGEVAQQQEMKEVYFADLEIFSVLRVWNEYTVHVYGK
jgi:hypothetical protein